jgi:excisionase family DNA binding protein
MRNTAGLDGTPPGPQHVKLLLTPDEAAHALGIKRTKLYEMSIAGELESIKIGASRRFLLRSLEAYVERQCALQKVG